MNISCHPLWQKEDKEVETTCQREGQRSTRNESRFFLRWESNRSRNENYRGDKRATRNPETSIEIAHRCGGGFLPLALLPRVVFFSPQFSTLRAIMLTRSGSSLTFFSFPPPRCPLTFQLHRRRAHLFLHFTVPSIVDLFVSPPPFSPLFRHASLRVIPLNVIDPAPRPPRSRSRDSFNDTEYALRFLLFSFFFFFLEEKMSTEFRKETVKMQRVILWQNFGGERRGIVRNYGELFDIVENCAKLRRTANLFVKTQNL